VFSKDKRLIFDIHLKFRVDRMCNFEDIVIGRFSKFGLKCLFTGQKMSVLGMFRPLNIIGHCRDPQKSLPCVKPRQMSHQALKWVQTSVVFAVGDDKKKGKERKGTISHKVVIFHVIAEKPPVNGF